MTDQSISILLTNSNVSHDLIQTEYPKRTRQCKEAAKLLGVDSLRDVTRKTLEGMMTYSIAPPRLTIGRFKRTFYGASGLGKNVMDINKHERSSIFTLRHNLM